MICKNCKWFKQCNAKDSAQKSSDYVCKEFELSALRKKMYLWYLKLCLRRCLFMRGLRQRSMQNKELKVILEELKTVLPMEFGGGSAEKSKAGKD